MHPPSACGFGSSLLSQTSNSTLVVFEHCAGCRIQDALSHAAVNTTELRSIERQTTRAHDDSCDAHARVAAGALHRRHLRDQPESEYKGLASMSTIRPTSGCNHHQKLLRHYAAIRGSTRCLHTWQCLNGKHYHHPRLPAYQRIRPLFCLCCWWYRSACRHSLREHQPYARGYPSNQPDHSQQRWLCKFFNVWIDIGAGVNTVRLDNVGLINGGTGVRMSSPSTAQLASIPVGPCFCSPTTSKLTFLPATRLSCLLASTDKQRLHTGCWEQCSEPGCF